LPDKRRQGGKEGTLCGGVRFRIAEKQGGKKISQGGSEVDGGGGRGYLSENSHKGKNIKAEKLGPRPGEFEYLCKLVGKEGD